MEQEIDQPRAVAVEELGVELLLTRPDAGKRGHGGEQRVEDARAHALRPATRIRIVARGDAAGNDGSKTAAGHQTMYWTTPPSTRSAAPVVADACSEQT